MSDQPDQPLPPEPAPEEPSSADEEVSTPVDDQPISPAIRWGTRAAKGALGILMFATLAGYLGGYGWFFDLFSHFKLQLFLGGIAVMGFFSWMRNQPWAMATALCVLINFVEIIPWYMPASSPQSSLQGYSVRMMVSNVNLDNQQYKLVLEQVRKERPAVVAFLEVTPQWAGKLVSLQDIYPHYVLQPRPGNFGIALFSQFPLKKSQTQNFLRLGPDNKPHDTPSITAEISIHGNRVYLVATHPWPPLNPELYERRNRQLKALGTHLAKEKLPLIVLGDLNTSMWSAHYRQFVNTAKLKNARRGFGIHPTWPGGSIIGLPFSIPFDHVLVSPGIRVVNFRTGSYVGSDHYPILADLFFPKKPQ